MTTKFILVRHGQTEWNRVERFRGQVDIPLNETGKAQAQKVAARLAGDKIDVLYASPLSRTMQTAEPIAAGHQLEIQKHDTLMDIDIGALEGLTVEEAKQSFPEVIDKWMNAPGHVKFPKGESIKTVANRLQALLEELSTRHPDQTVALVSHRVMCHILVCLVLGLDLDAMWSIRQDNACINRFEKTERGYVLTLLNETGHLA